MTGRDALFEPVRRLFEQVWNQGRLELLDAIATEELVLHAGRNAVSGRGTLRNIIGDFLTGFPDVKHRVDDLVIEGDRVVTRWRGVGHHRGSYDGIAPTGREIDYTGITIFRIAEGRIAEAGVNAEMAELLASLRAP
ncbi:MAG TPA: ester cyclase [Dongiaceae bacterium]|nr:ester cyclase [Dongiaceae bacterium]